jgi:DNA-binding response OmpR family regulator
MSKILLVEDDQSVTKTLTNWLKSEGHLVEHAVSGPDAWQMLSNYKYDIIVLDRSLPAMSGIEVLKKFRSTGGTTPVIILTGDSHLSSKKEGLDSGADDYLTKPFEPEELSARIRSILRRPPGLLPTVLTIGNVTADLTTQQVMVEGQSIRLSKTEYAVLEFLMRNPNRCFSSQELLASVWPSDTDSTEEAVRTLGFPLLHGQ